MEPGRVDVTREKGTTVVLLAGNFDFAYTADLDKTMTDLVESGETGLVLDMAETGYVGSTAVGGVLGCAGRLRRRGGELRLCNVPACSQDVFDLLGVYKFVAVYGSRAEALKATPRTARERLGIPERRAGGDRRQGDRREPTGASAEPPESRR